MHAPRALYRGPCRPRRARSGATRHDKHPGTWRARPTASLCRRSEKRRMIPRLLVPMGAQLPAVDAASTRRRPTTLDDRKLVPSTLPIIQLDGKSTIPSSLPLESIAARVVVPRDVKPSEFVREEKEDLPLQPTDLDERVIVPQGAAPPEIIEPIQIQNIPTDLVETDVFMTGEVNLLNK